MLFSWIFTLGGLLGFVVMLYHSIIFKDREETLFIFGGGFVLAYLLEYTLANIFDAYTYQHLPLTVFAIPLVIPAGWVVTFYGLLQLSDDLLNLSSVKPSAGVRVLLTSVLGLIFGLGIEVLARLTEFWQFHFTAVEFVGVPIIVPLAWGLSIAFFCSGIIAFDRYRKWWPIILLLVHLSNVGVGWVLLSLT